MNAGASARPLQPSFAPAEALRDTRADERNANGALNCAAGSAEAGVIQGQSCSSDTDRFAEHLVLALDHRARIAFGFSIQGIFGRGRLIGRGSIPVDGAGVVAVVRREVDDGYPPEGLTRFVEAGKLGSFGIGDSQCSQRSP